MLSLSAIIIKTIESCMRSQQTLFSLERSFFIFCFESYESYETAISIYARERKNERRQREARGSGGWVLRARRALSLPF